MRAVIERTVRTLKHEGTGHEHLPHKFPGQPAIEDGFIYCPICHGWFRRPMTVWDVMAETSQYQG